ncbi:hypothetical protein DMP17_44855 [Pseudonocardia sp. TMWB2A]|uniref:hypothetical protein n=1 Tax=Pseudonocardia sp. TMWB2A TaxID=687430 RepID=UPI00307E876E
MDLTPLQRITLHRLVEGEVTAATAHWRSLRWLRRYGLVDADHVPTDEGRAYLVELRAEVQRRRDARDAAEDRRRREDPLWGMRDSIRRWKAGERDR